MQAVECRKTRAVNGSSKQSGTSQRDRMEEEAPEATAPPLEIYGEKIHDLLAESSQPAPRAANPPPWEYPSHTVTNQR